MWEAVVEGDGILSFILKEDMPNVRKINYSFIGR